MLVPVSPSADPPRDAELARALEVLGSPVRLTLLRQLRVPKTITEVRVRVRPARGGDTSRPRTLARQTVKGHLDKLLELGLVTARETVRDHGPTIEYLIDHRALYALGDEVRELALLRPSSEMSLGTLEATSETSPAVPKGPSLVLVKGLEEGRVFPLASPGGAARAWVIGRRRDLDVPLDYDGYVSGRHAELALEDQRYTLADLGSRNGTRLNFEPVPEGQRRVLSPGDVIGVGHSLLVVRL